MNASDFLPGTRRFVMVVASLIALGVNAQETAREPSPLTLERALVLAAENNPSLAALSYGERAAEAFIEQAGLRPNPTLDVSAENFLGTGRVQGVRSLETTVQVSQSFERGGKRDRRVTLASRERESAAKAFAVRRSEVLASTALGFVEMVAAQERLALAEEPLKLARETLAVVEARVNEGAVSPVESARARAAAASALGEFTRAQSALTAARSKLAGMWGGKPGDVGAVRGHIQMPDTVPSEDVFLSRITDHPRREFQQAIIASRRASLEWERAQAAQDVTVGGGVRFLREGTDAAFVAGVSIPLPARNRNQGGIRAARETVAGAEQTLRALEAELRVSITSAWQELSAAHKTAQTLRREVLPATEEAHAVVRRAYEEGQLPLIDVLDAQRSLVALRREIFEAEASCALALARAEGLSNSGFTFTTTLISSP